MSTTESAEAERVHLETLAAALADTDLTTKIVQPPDAPPYLRVVNTTASQLAEDITIADGHYQWSWKQPITSVGAVKAAALAIIHVLTPEGTWRT